MRLLLPAIYEYRVDVVHDEKDISFCDIILFAYPSMLITKLNIISDIFTIMTLIEMSYTQGGDTS